MQRDSTQKVADLRTFRRKEGLSQAAVAREAGVSQSTVSRRERKPPQRHSDATYKLCSYAEKEVGEGGGPGRKKGVRKAFDEVWNRSDAHARAISKIIEAFAEFCKAQR
jgi:transcriptional regulator with XRE-family HTH domain